MNKYNLNGWVLICSTISAVLVGVFDYIVRTYNLGWTESPISQSIVFYSPLVYFALFILLLLRLITKSPSLSSRSNKLLSLFIVVYSALVIAQIFLQRQGVGSATYSIVYPLYLSGAPLSIMTFLLFFRKERGFFQGSLVCMVVVLWFVMPMGIDGLYTMQGGHRGPDVTQLAVISTSYDLITWAAGLGFFVAFIAATLAILITIYRIFKASGAERQYSLAVGLSIFALSIQFINWGGFVWD